MGIRQKLATALLGLLPALTGCLSHTRIIEKTRPAENVQDATLEQLVQQTNARYNAIQNLTAYISIHATTRSPLAGIEKDSVNFSGFIFIRKPEDLSVILKVPLLGSRAFDAVSNGKDFKVYIPSQNRVIEGANAAPQTEKGLYSLRPAVLFDSMLVRGTSPGQIVSLTSDTRIIPDADKKKASVEEPDYNLQLLSPASDGEANTLRIVHISRVDLLPYQQDIFDQKGNVVTRAFYSKYQKYGDVQFPSVIVIKRPLDQYSLTITITKLDLAQKLEDDQFDLKIPDGVRIEQMK
jgi:outer membrane lipoprotein-sorting protein